MINGLHRGPGHILHMVRYWPWGTPQVVFLGTQSWGLFPIKSLLNLTRDLQNQTLPMSSQRIEGFPQKTKKKTPLDCALLLSEKCSRLWTIQFTRLYWVARKGFGNDYEKPESVWTAALQLSLKQHLPNSNCSFKLAVRKISLSKNPTSFFSSKCPDFLFIYLTCVQCYSVWICRSCWFQQPIIQRNTSSKNALSSKRKNAKSHRSEEQREAPPAMFLEKKVLGNAA